MAGGSLFLAIPKHVRMLWPGKLQFSNSRSSRECCVLDGRVCTDSQCTDGILPRLSSPAKANYLRASVMRTVVPGGRFSWEHQQGR